MSRQTATPGTTSGTAPVPHPAKFTPAILDVISDMLDAHLPHGATVLDPFAGVGGIHDLSDRWDTYAVELEPEWAVQAAERGTTWCGNFFDLPCAIGPVLTWPEHFDAVVTSPAYGNRMADNHQPGPDDTSTRITYRHKLGRPLSDGNSGGIQWGRGYRAFHRRAWRQVAQMTVAGGLFVLNVKDHVRAGEAQGVPEWHNTTVRALGFDLVETTSIPVRGMGFGANQQTMKIPFENVYLFRRNMEAV